MKNKDQDIINIAISKLGEGGYDIVYNNCEHFVNYCIFNTKKSDQVENVREEIRRKLNINK